MPIKFWWCEGLFYFALRIPSIRAEARQYQQSTEANYESLLQESLKRIKN